MPTHAWPPGGRRGVPHTYTLFCPPLPTAPRIARDYVATVLRSLDLRHLADDAALCTSEVVTNAYRCGGNRGSLLLLAVGCGEVRVTVYDSDPCLPVVRSPGGRADPGDGAGAMDAIGAMDGNGEAESGRGLRLVHALSRGRWGTEPGAPTWLGGAGGKGVWFALGDAPATGVASAVN